MGKGHSKPQLSVVDDYWSAAICFLSQPRYVHPSFHDTNSPLMIKHRDTVFVQHYGAAELPQPSTLKLEERKTGGGAPVWCLNWTHPNNRHLHHADEFIMPLHVFMCVGYAHLGDSQAPDLNPPGVNCEQTEVLQEHGFWVHCPQKQRTFYFYAKTADEQVAWIQHIRHNLEVKRHGVGVDEEIITKCDESLREHGYSPTEVQRKLNRVRQALRDRQYKQIDRHSLELEDQMGWAIYQGRLDTMRKLLSARPKHGCMQVLNTLCNTKVLMWRLDTFPWHGKAVLQPPSCSSHSRSCCAHTACIPCAMPCFCCHQYSLHMHVYAM